MAYDNDLAARVREQLAGARPVTEKAMFGGLAFLLGGNMSVGIRGEDLMVRVGQDGTDAALERPHARLSFMGERPMRGWILVGPEGVAADSDLGAWVSLGVEYARSLPPKG